jgi:hypothetical protein
MPKTNRTTSLQRLAHGRVSCDEVGCEFPLGRRQEGFTRWGLIQHKTKVHPVKAAPLYEAKTVTELPTSVGYDTDGEGNEALDYVFALEKDGIAATQNVDFGTPGDEVVMGEPLGFDTQSAIDDIKQVLDPISIVRGGPQFPHHPAPVESLPEKGNPEKCIRIKARDGVLLVDLGEGWEEWSLEQFFNNIRIAIAIS